MEWLLLTAAVFLSAPQDAAIYRVARFLRDKYAMWRKRL